MTTKIGKSANDIYNAQYQEVSWVIPNLIPAGMTTLAARPKTGKSWFSMQVSKEVSSRGKMFGEQVEGGKVLYLSLEDNDRRLKKRMEMQKWTERARKNVDFITFNDFVKNIGFLHLDGTSKQGLGNVKKLYKEVESGKYKLLVIDTFSNAFLGLKNIDDNQIITLALKPLQDISLGKNIVTLINDHHNKMSDTNPNLRNDVLGSTAKVSISDTVIGLYNKGRGILRLMATGKEIDDMDFIIKRNEYFVFEKDNKSIPGLTNRDIEILERLSYDYVGAMKLASLSSLVNEAEGNLSNRLGKLRRLGYVERTDLGFIRLNGHTPQN